MKFTLSTSIGNDMKNDREDFEKYISGLTDRISEFDDLAGAYKDIALQAVYRAYIAGKREGINLAVNKLKELHGKTLGRHNYYANAAIEIKRMTK